MTKSTCPCGATLELPVTDDSFTRGEYTVRLKLWTDAHAACLAARNALPPAPTPSPVDDGPPEPLPEVLPKGTRGHRDRASGWRRGEG